MCEYCEGEKKLFAEKELEYQGWGAGSPVDYEDRFVFIDRGYLRYTTDDYGCLDHGEKIEINYCPMCGERLNNG